MAGFSAHRMEEQRISETLAGASRAESKDCPATDNRPSRLFVSCPAPYRSKACRELREPRRRDLHQKRFQPLVEASQDQKSDNEEQTTEHRLAALTCTQQLVPPADHDLPGCETQEEQGGGGGPYAESGHHARHLPEIFPLCRENRGSATPRADAGTPDCTKQKAKSELALQPRCGKTAKASPTLRPPFLTGQNFANG